MEFFKHLYIYLHIYTFVSVPETHPEHNLVDRKSFFYLSEQHDRLDEAFRWFSERWIRRPAVLRGGGAGTWWGRCASRWAPAMAPPPAVAHRRGAGGRAWVTVRRTCWRFRWVWTRGGGAPFAGGAATVARACFAHWSRFFAWRVLQGQTSIF